MSDQLQIQAIQAVATAMNNLAKVMANVFPQQAGTSTTATGGSTITLPTHPVGFQTITLPDGTSAKIPYYST